MPKYKYIIGEKKEHLPEFYCATCLRNIDSRCTFYNRKIEPKFNKCFNHTNYHPVATQYKSPANIKEIAEENARKDAA